MTKKPDMDSCESNFRQALHLLCRKRSELYGRYRAGEIGREEYLEAMGPLDRALDDLELSLVRGSGFFRRVL